MSQTDIELLTSFKAGDDASLEVLISRYSDQLRRVLVRLTGDTEVAEDLTQETWVRAWKNIDSFDMQKSFKTWIFSIARNAAIDWQRKKKAVPLSRFEDETGGNVVADNIVDTEPLAHEMIASMEDTQFARRLLEQLTPEQQRVMIMRYNEERSFEEIGQALGKPMNTVKSHHRRALIALRNLVSSGSLHLMPASIRIS